MKPSERALSQKHFQNGLFDVRLLTATSATNNNNNNNNSNSNSKGVTANGSNNNNNNSNNRMSKTAIRAAIESAKTIQEVHLLEQSLANGSYCDNNNDNDNDNDCNTTNTKKNEEDEEMDEG